ncbi:DUF4386 domain-containing protein [Flagellimonas flava]|uniref:DUF4386 domain-containing protein n=1 Tax=Flagellimonas flava TaxID=570519 RepID=A0A1M5I5B1_9FLAO|nr:DUF4386 domain-containing protein [Allomuricauda flava]SHG23367.1 protein of unknown function [Allomuricauda flava]
MQTNQKIGRTIGFLLLIIIALGIPSVIFRGLSSSLVNSSDFLSLVSENAMEMRIAVLLDIIVSALWIAVAAVVFPYLKKFNNQLALAYMAIWSVYFGIIIFSNISHLSLISLSQEFETMGQLNSEYFTLVGRLKVDDYFWAHFFGIMLYASAAFIFYYFLFHKRYVPRFLSLWGMIAISIVFVACWLNIFEVDISFHFFSQNGLHMIILMGWLVAKGFSEPKAP